MVGGEPDEWSPPDRHRIRMWPAFLATGQATPPATRIEELPFEPVFSLQDSCDAFRNTPAAACKYLRWVASIPPPAPDHRPPPSPLPGEHDLVRVARLHHDALLQLEELVALLRDTTVTSVSRCPARPADVREAARGDVWLRNRPPAPPAVTTSPPGSTLGSNATPWRGMPRTCLEREPGGIPTRCRRHSGRGRTARTPY